MSRRCGTSASGKKEFGVTRRTLLRARRGVVSCGWPEFVLQIRCSWPSRRAIGGRLLCGLTTSMVPVPILGFTWLCVAATRFGDHRLGCLDIFAGELSGGWRRCRLAGKEIGEKRVGRWSANVWSWLNRVPNLIGRWSTIGWPNWTLSTVPSRVICALQSGSGGLEHSSIRSGPWDGDRTHRKPPWVF
jgi:hypothetical protein